MNGIDDYKRKHHTVTVRLDENDMQLLDEITRRTGENTSKTIREALRIYGNLVKYKE